jgi:ArsR family transcriptional regulator
MVGERTEGNSTDDARLAAYAKALGHPIRVQIMRVLLARDRCITGELVEELPVAQSTASEHLRVLRSAGLIQGRVDGPRVCYCVDPFGVEDLRLLLGALAPTCCR